jgi:glycosyltransferase involved in cell wall biosynthesis
MENLSISVVVAVYQAEKYIKRCLDSIIAQTFKDFEVLLIDDGSLDSSGMICDGYAARDSRFRVIHKQNEGVSSARQTGLNAAKGKYIIHADPDDWAEPDWLQKMYEKIEKETADIVICDFERIYKDKKVHYVQKPRSLDNDDIIADMLEEKIWGSCWNKMIKRDIFKQYNVSFNPRMTIWEDIYVMCLLIARGAKITYLPVILYHYDSVINKKSIVRFISISNTIQSLMIFINDLYPILSSHEFDDGWYHIKSKVKDDIFLLNNHVYDIKAIYPDINQRYINESRNCHIWSMKACVGLCLCGHSVAAHFIYNVFAPFRRLRNIIVRLTEQLVGWKWKQL